MVFCRFFAPTDLSAYMDGFLHLWVYVDDLSKVTGGMIEITSYAGVDNQERYWNLTDYLTKSGWNELFLPLPEALTQGDAAFNPKEYQCMRIVVMQSGDIIAGIGSIAVTRQGPNGTAASASGQTLFFLQAEIPWNKGSFLETEESQTI